MIYNILLVGFGGAIGSILRYLTTEVLTKSCKILTSSIGKFPVGAFAVNIIGSLVAGILYFFIIKNFEDFSPQLKNFLLVGILGGFTTFSAFTLDFFRLFTSGNHIQALIYATSSVILAILMLFFGFYSTKFIFA